jgi:hypothetical protein
MVLVRALWVLALLASLTVGASARERADPASDAPEADRPKIVAFKDAATYADALKSWRTAEDVNAWIGARFSYDMARAMALSESQRRNGASLPIHAPADFFATPAGICVDLSRFAVETLRQVDPSANASYLMIEFAPVTIAGNTLRLHWVASYRRDGQWYFFADSKRPGHLAGPYATVQAFIDDYAAYRGRTIVAFKELPSYQRRQRSLAVKEQRETAR